MKISNKQYISAFYEVAKSKNLLEESINQLEKISKNYLSVKNFLNNPNIEMEDKKEFFGNIGINDLIINLFLSLRENSNLDQIKNITLGLKETINQKSNILEVTIISAKLLEEQEISNIKNKLEKDFNKKIIIAEQVMPEILGGIILKIGDKYINGSIQNKLAILKNSLLSE